MVSYSVGEEASCKGSVLSPSPRYGGVTEFAPTVYQVKLPQKIPFSLYQYLLAVVAIGMTSFMTGHVTQIDIMDPFLYSQISELFEGGNGRRR